MRRLRKKLVIHKLNIRIAIYFTSLLILFCIAISLINARLYSKQVIEETESVYSQKLELITGVINKDFVELQKLHYGLVNNDYIRNSYIKTIENPTGTNIENLNWLISKDYASQDVKINSVIPLGMDGEVYSLIAHFPAYQSLVKSDDYKGATQTLRFQKMTLPNSFPLEYTNPDESQKTNITLYAQYYDKINFQTLGYLAINIRKENLFYDIKEVYKDSFDTIYVIDTESKELVYQIGNIEYQAENILDKNKYRTEINDLNYIGFSNKVVEYREWAVVGIISENQLYTTVNQLNKTIYLVLGIFIVAMVLTSIKISSTVTEPIKNVVESMEEFKKGNWPLPLEVSASDELGSLVSGYNVMLTNVLSLTSDIIKRHEDNKDLEINLIRKNIELLEAQINPHFIHNTLNSINYLVLKEGMTNVSEIIESFNNLLRTSMAVGVEFISVIKEVENIKDYCKIQNLRYPDVFSLDIIVDDNCRMAKIPKLILQPIVENSIIHGIIPKRELGVISINIKKDGDEVNIVVMDDGAGFQRENEKNKLTSSNRNEDLSMHIGLKNIKDRLELYYKEESSFEVYSTIGEGTTVVISIPFSN